MSSDTTAGTGPHPALPNDPGVDLSDDDPQDGPPAGLPLMGLDPFKVAQAAAAWLGYSAVRLQKELDEKCADPAHVMSILYDLESVDVPATVNGLPGHRPEVRVIVMSYAWFWLSTCGYLTVRKYAEFLNPTPETLTDPARTTETIVFLTEAADRLRKASTDPIQAAADADWPTP